MALKKVGTPKERMQKAHALIKQKKYPAARTLLKGIDHPTAQQWRDKLDEILLEQDDPFADDPFVDKTPVVEEHTPENRPVDISQLGTLKKPLPGTEPVTAENVAKEIVKQQKKEKEEKQQQAAIGCLVLLFLWFLCSIIYASPLLSPNGGGGNVDIVKSAFKTHASSRNIESVQIADGRSNGGEVGLIVAYRTIESSDQGYLNEWYELFQAIGFAIADNDLDIDSVTLIAGTSTGEAAVILVCKSSDLIDFYYGRISFDTFFSKIETTSF